VVNYIDRAAISYAIPLIERDLHLSPADTGAILGAFGLGYAITTLVGGFAVDRSPAACSFSMPRACCSGCRKGPTFPPSPAS
jgi:predicted MFS family arabinose efflux permease